jgi:hypothetical protein
MLLIGYQKRRKNPNDTDDCIIIKKNLYDKINL